MGGDFMKKKFMAMLLSMSLLGTVGGCGITTDINEATGGGKAESVETGTEGVENTDNGKTIGILMPTKSSERWINDGNDMVEELQKLGYKTDLQYAEDIVETQV